METEEFYNYILKKYDINKEKYEHLKYSKSVEISNIDKSVEKLLRYYISLKISTDNENTIKNFINEKW